MGVDYSGVQGRELGIRGCIRKWVMGVIISELNCRMRKNLYSEIFSYMHVCKYVNIGSSLPLPPCHH